MLLSPSLYFPKGTCFDVLHPLGIKHPLPQLSSNLTCYPSATVKSRLLRFATKFIRDELQFLSLIISSMFKVRWGSSLETTLAGDGGVGSTGAGGGTIEGTAGDGGVGSTGAGGGTIEDTACDGGVGSTGAGGGTIEDTACDGGVGSTGAGRGTMEDTAGDDGVGSTGAGRGTMEVTGCNGMSEGCVILLMSTRYDNTVSSRLSII